MKDKKMIIIGLKAFGIMLVIFVLGYWLRSAYPSFVKNREEINKFKPMIKEAKNLNLNYAQVASDKHKFKGNHVIWCVQNRGTGEAFSMERQGGRLFVTNYSKMPIFGGSKHASCADMLLKIKHDRETSFNSNIVDVEFLYKLK